MSSVRDGLLGTPVGLVGVEARALVPEEPDPSCALCIVLAALPFPEEEPLADRSDRCCAFHRPLYRRLQCQSRCQDWNADHAHQVAAGKARAQQFTMAYQRAAGRAAFDAFSARWRATQGLAPLSAEAVRRYLTPEMIRGPLGLALRPDLQATIYRAWCAGILQHVTAWNSDDPPPDPDGLWAGR